MHSCPTIGYDTCMHPLGACAIAIDYYVVLDFFICSASPPYHFHPSFNYLLQIFFKISCYIIKRNVNLIYSAVKPPIKIRLWNTETFEHLQRSLIRWLDGYIADGEKIRRIQRLVTVYNYKGEIRLWNSVKTDTDCCIMIHSCEDIVPMVVIAHICYLIVVFVCLVV